MEERNRTFFLEQAYRRELQKIELGWVGRILEIPGVVGQPCSTTTEALVSLEKTFGEWIDEALRLQWIIPKPVDATVYSGKFVFRCSPELHRSLAIESERQNLSLNTFLQNIAVDKMGSPGVGKKYLSDYVFSGILKPSEADSISSTLYDGGRILIFGENDEEKTLISNAILHEMYGMGGSCYTVGIFDPQRQWDTRSSIDTCWSEHENVQEAFLDNFLHDRNVGPELADSNVMYIGEMRDNISSKIAMESASTGTLVRVRVGATPMIFANTLIRNKRVIYRLLRDWSQDFHTGGLVLFHDWNKEKNFRNELQVETWIQETYGYTLPAVADLVLRVDNQAISVTDYQENR